MSPKSLPICWFLLAYLSVFVLIFVPPHHHHHHHLTVLAVTPLSPSRWSAACVDYTCTGDNPFASSSGTNCFEVSLHLSVSLLHMHIQTHIPHPLNLRPLSQTVTVPLQIFASEDEYCLNPQICYFCNIPLEIKRC